METVVGEETGDGEVTIMGSSGRTETGTGGTEVDISRDLKAPTENTIPITRDGIITTTDLYSNHSSYVSI